MNESAAANGADTITASLRLTGEFDIGRKDELERILEAAHHAHEAVIDVSGVSYMDSSALTMLIRMRKRMMEHGPGIVRLTGIRAQVKKIFSLTNLDRIFALEE